MPGLAHWPHNESETHLEQATLRQSARPRSAPTDRPPGVWGAQSALS